MFMDELRTIRERKSMETLGMTTEQLNDYYKTGADEMMNMIEEIRKASVDSEKQPLKVHQ
jgi:hypothetical protein